MGKRLLEIAPYKISQGALEFKHRDNLTACLVGDCKTDFNVADFQNHPQ